ncbi:LacI family transcriptional regulator [Acrocarpospora pleiomorpha]|uniref:LacI family transcriptional regulator n=1 Tax=Acrocarpospora pleiomorpha TaxID=90975 RepID=A0A5M3XCH1_9ACTN|nr:LacI family DNA-binding transcriptional regulator [Acrocarpospora pleiomorpha]GES17211.1 LacI family transcriptional regulator [Acrocarpospora pleiomorpha]
MARAVGVTPATVSYALNGLPGVSEELRDQIKAVADEMGFRPSRLAVGLRLGRTNTLGLLLPDVANPFYPELASGVIEGASAEGMQVFVAQVGLDGRDHASAVSALVDSHCEGLLFTAVLPHDIPMLTDLRARGVPFGLINRRIEGLDADWVGIDDFAAARELTSLVLEGRQSVAVFGGPERSSVSAGRAAGARAALAAAGRTPLPDGMVGDLTRESGVERARALFDARGPVDLVVCGNDVIALGVMDVCHERGLAVPDDVAVTGFDDMSFASAGPLRLTTVEVPRHEMGRQAVAGLRRRMLGFTGEPQVVELPYTVRRRNTA